MMGVYMVAVGRGLHSARSTDPAAGMVVASPAVLWERPPPKAWALPEQFASFVKVAHMHTRALVTVR